MIKSLLVILWKVMNKEKLRIVLPLLRISMKLLPQDYGLMTVSSSLTKTVNSTIVLVIESLLLLTLIRWNSFWVISLTKIDSISLISNSISIAMSSYKALLNINQLLLLRIFKELYNSKTISLLNIMISSLNS